MAEFDTAQDRQGDTEFELRTRVIREETSAGVWTVYLSTVPPRILASGVTRAQADKFAEFAEASALATSFGDPADFDD